MSFKKNNKRGRKDIKTGNIWETNGNITESPLNKK